MTVQRLIDELLSCDPDALVVLSKDGEGNDFSPLSEIDPGVYTAESTYAGEFVPLAHAPAGAPVNAICLWPVN